MIRRVDRYSDEQICALAKHDVDVREVNGHTYGNTEGTIKSIRRLR